MDNRRKKPVITGITPSSSGTPAAAGQKAVVKQHVTALYSSVNPFEADRRKENHSSTPVLSGDKRKNPPSKTASASSLTTPTACKRLSSDFHRKCCADENDHDERSCKSSSDRKQRAAESPSPSGDRSVSRRSQSVPRTALRPIVTTTLSTIKRMEFNLERARDAAINSPMPKSPYSSPYTMSTRRTAVAASGSRAPATPTVFSTTKTPVQTARIAKAIMSGSKPRTPPAAAARALTLPKSVTTNEAGRSTPADERKATSESKTMAAVSYSSARVSVKPPTTGKDVADRRPHQEADHVTVTQSGGKGNVNIRMKISMDMAVVKAYHVEKTAVTVTVRLRPFSTMELKSPSIHRVVYLDKERHCVKVNRTEFEFNHVLDSFDPDPIDDQEQVYEVVGKPLLDHCLEGYNACLFAYGQTGSGKTYSLTGEEDVVYFEKQGVIPRLIKDLFLEMHLDSIVSMTYIEIYNDQIFNLLGDTTSDLQQLTYKIRESTIYGPYIPNLAPVIVESADDLLSRWSMGNIKRQKAATSCNEHSSRSHAILQITVQQKYQDDTIDSVETRESDADSQVSDGDRLVSKINLVDLAGSERVAQAQTTGDRFKEGTAINKSLLTLGKVISELSSMNEHRNKVHIPYRESALTFLLKESLGGNSRTCMLATISPANTQIEETLSTLRYASKAQRIVNQVRINEDPKIIRIRQLESELHRLQQILSEKGISAKALPQSASPTAATVTISSPSTTEPNSSFADSSNASAAVTPAPSDYETPMKTSKKGKSAKDGESAEKDDKQVKSSKDKCEKSDKKSANKQETKKKDEKSTTAHDDAASEKKKSKKKESGEKDQSADKTHDTKDTTRKGQKNKQSSPIDSEDGAASSPKKDKKSAASSEKASKKTKESSVNTDSSPTEPKKKKVQKLALPPAPKSKLLDAIGEIFPDVPVQSDIRSGDRSQDTTGMTSLTYVSAGDGSSLLNQAVIESSSSAMSDSTVQEASRHVNFRDTVSMRSYQVSMNSTAVEPSTASSSPKDKKSPKKSGKKQSTTPEPVAKEQESDWGAGASGGWGSGTETAHAADSGGWGSSSNAEPAADSQEWGTSSDTQAAAASGGWGSTSDAKSAADAGGWGSEPAAESWGEDSAGDSTAQLSYSQLAADEEGNGEGWTALMKDNGLNETQNEDKKDDGDGGWGGGGSC